ncbi:MAG: universal stress protein, partial [Sphingomonadales bacterium]|nr:universal stress protein [Sphingomonadales bacterium]
QLILLLLVGRLLGEGMTRIGQPAIFGQLLAGVVLGPSLFGALLPELRQQIFPDAPALKSMIKAVSEIGILLLLLLTGMETNLGLVNRNRRAVVSSSVFGIAMPFLCGVILASVLPARLFPNIDVWFVSALFLGTALSISSVKIVAMVLMEVGAIRRDLGQLILATAILDDTIAWILIAVIAGLAAHGTVSLVAVATSLAGTLAFLVLSLTIGRRLVAWLIRWTNDNFLIEVPVITAILVVMLVMALSTELIGVHTALGAFIAGMLVGQSPILTEHIEEQLRGFIIAFFSPVFFAVAGLGMDLRTLLEPALLGFTVAIIAVATIGKFLGALFGGRLGGLTGRESIALATALNARGSTEVIIAAIGLSMGVLGTELYTMIVAMAVVTTMIMPPSLRWMLARVPVRTEEAQRLEKEEEEAKQSVPKMERLLMVCDDSANGLLAARLAGTFSAGERVLATVLDVAANKQPRHSGEPPALETSKGGCGRGRRARHPVRHPAFRFRAAPSHRRARACTSRRRSRGHREGGSKGLQHGFCGHRRADRGRGPPLRGQVGAPGSGLRWSGRHRAQWAPRSRNHKPATQHHGAHRWRSHAWLATEVALALVKATGGRLTVFHVFDPHDDVDLLRGRQRRGLGVSVLDDARRLGKRSGVRVDAVTATNARPDVAIRREVATGSFHLVVVGAALRTGKTKFLGPRSAALAQRIKVPTLLIVQ